MAKATFFAQRRQRELSGLMAKKEGAWFESWLKTSCAQRRWAVIKFPSGCEWVSAVRAKPVRVPFDFVFVKDGVSIFGDAKTTNEKNWSFSKTTPHQLHWLSYLETHGAIAGYVVNFREQSQTVFFSAKQLTGLKPRCSLKPIEGILIGNNYEVNLDEVASVHKEKALHGIT